MGHVSDHLHVLVRQASLAHYSFGIGVHIPRPDYQQPDLGVVPLQLGVGVEQVLEPLTLLHPPDEQDIHISIVELLYGLYVGVKPLQVYTVGDDGVVPGEVSRYEFQRRLGDRYLRVKTT